METKKVEIDINKSLSPGDIVELHFKTVGMTWIQATQIASIEWWFKLTKPPFEILEWSIPEDNKVIFTIRVKKTNPFPITVVVIAAAICAVGVIAWLTLDKAYQVLETPGGQIVATGFSTVTIIILILVSLSVYRSLHGK